MIKTPKKEVVMAEQTAIALKEYLKFEVGEQWQTVVKIIHEKAILIYGKTED